MSKLKLRFGVIGCGLMGKEFASAVSRWLHLTDHPVQPEIIGVCDQNPEAMAWFAEHLPSVQYQTTDYKELLSNPEIDAIYCAVPHHLHQSFYIDIIESGKHLLGEKPFGMDQAANRAIAEAAQNHPEVVVRCSSEFPFYPGVYQAYNLIREGFLGQIIDVETGFWHGSDLNPNKPINWKRVQSMNGEYGCMGDLGMHAVHLPARLGWLPQTVFASLSNLVTKRPGPNGDLMDCDTWDNAILLTESSDGHSTFPITFSFKRIAPGHANTWYFKANGMKGSIEYSTQNPKQLKTLTYEPGGKQAWEVMDVEYKSAYPTITGGIFEFGFSDSILQMWAAFCDEVASASQQTKAMKQPFYCATLEETSLSHALFTAALESHHKKATIDLT